MATLIMEENIMKNIFLTILLVLGTLAFMACAQPNGGDSFIDDTPPIDNQNSGGNGGSEGGNGEEGNGGDEEGEIEIAELTSEHFPKDWYLVYEGNEYPIEKYGLSDSGYQTFDDFDSLPANHMVSFDTIIHEETGFKLYIAVRRDGNRIIHNDKISTGPYGSTYALSKIVEKDDNIYFYWVFVKYNHGE